MRPRAVIIPKQKPRYRTALLYLLVVFAPAVLIAMIAPVGTAIILTLFYECCLAPCFVMDIQDRSKQ